MTRLEPAFAPRAAAALFVALLALLPHAPAARAGFTYDDYEFVQNNASLASVSRALFAWLRPFPPEQPERGLYRPLTALSYAIDGSFAGTLPHSFHISNLLLYVTCSELVLLLAWRLFDSASLALVAAAVFALHPVHCEVVDSISGRSELLALLFSLTALALFQSRHSHRTHVGYALAALAAALFAKETSVMTLGVLAVQAAIEQRWRCRAVVRAWVALWPFAVTTTAYLIVRAIALGGRLIPAHTYIGGSSIATRAFTAGRVFAEYATLLVLPLHLDIDAYYERTIGVQHHATTEAVCGLALACASAGLLWSLGRRLAQSPNRAVAATSLGLFSLWLYLVPVSHLVPFGALMAERFLFSPSFGFAIVFASIVGSIARSLRSSRQWSAMVVAVASYLCAYALRTYCRAQDWYDNVTLFSTTAALLPDDYRLQTNVARGYLEREDVEHAIPWLERSLRIKPTHPATLNNLAYAYLHSGRTAQAEQVLHHLLSASPRDPIAWYNVAIIAAGRGQLTAARDAYRRALTQNPNYAPAERDLAAVERLLTKAKYAVEHSGPPDAQTTPNRARELAAACAALGDNACVLAAHQRLAALREHSSGTERQATESVPPRSEADATSRPANEERVGGDHHQIEGESLNAQKSR